MRIRIECVLLVVEKGSLRVTRENDSVGSAGVLQCMIVPGAQGFYVCAIQLPRSGFLSE